MMAAPLFWHNYKTGEYDLLSNSPQTDEEATQYIPQVPAALSLYRALRDHKDLSILEAMAQVLEAATGKGG